MSTSSQGAVLDRMDTTSHPSPGSQGDEPPPPPGPRDEAGAADGGHRPGPRQVARNWDIGEEQALAWVHTGCPELRGVGQADPGTTEAGEALRERAMAFYHEAVTFRRLPRRRTSDCTTTTLRQTEEPMPLPPQVCADRRRKRDAFGRVRDGKAHSDEDLYWTKARRGATKRSKRSK